VGEIVNMMQLDAARLEGVASSVHVRREGQREGGREGGKKRGVERNGDTQVPDSLSHG
jgi:hypothetical protein